MCEECAKKNDVKVYKKIKEHPFYRKARSILERCTKEDDHNYYNYGGRGIKCELGNRIPEVVESLDKVPGYFTEAQVDRIDNNGNYTLNYPVHGTEIWYDNDGRPCKGNLRWTTPRESTLNTRSNVRPDDFKTVPRRKEKIVEVTRRYGLNENDFILIKSERYSTPGRPKYYAILKGEEKEFDSSKADGCVEEHKNDKGLTTADKYKYRPPVRSYDDPFYNIAKAILSRCNNSHDYKYRLYGARGIKCLIGDKTSDVVEFLHKIPGYKEGLIIDRTEPDADFSDVHPIHGEEVWTDEQGYQCLGTLRWANHKDLHVVKIVADESRLKTENLEKYPRRLSVLMKLIQENFNILNFVIIPVDNSSMSHKHPLLFKAIEKSKLTYEHLK